jgi:hypothetical protein
MVQYYAAATRTWAATDLIAPPQPNMAKPSDNFGRPRNNLSFVLAILLANNLADDSPGHLQVLHKYCYRYGRVYYQFCSV